MCRSLIAFALLLSAGAALGHGKHENGAAAAGCQDASLACARTATPAFTPDGSLWVVWAAGKEVRVASSSDLGRTFAPATTVFTATDLPIDNGPDARPKLVAGADGRLFVAFATRDEKFNGHVYLVHSGDGGRTFSKPEALTLDSPSQRFESLALAADGRLLAAWIDKRNAAAAKSKGAAYAGAALAVTTQAPGAAPLPARIARDNTCECCRIALVATPGGRAYLAFRNIFEGGVRDHALISFLPDGTPGPVQRVSDDDWKTDACPHQGPSLAVEGESTAHVVWYTAGRKRKGLFYARSTDAGQTFTAPLPLGRKGQQVSRPAVEASQGRVAVAWKEFDGERTEIRGMTSGDGGATWSPVRTLADTRDDSDHPLLIARGKEIYLSWLTKTEGYRLLPVADGAP